MKKAFITLAACAIAVGSFAQAKKGDDPKKHRFGFKVAPNVAWIKSDKPQKIAADGARLGFSYGFTYDLSMTKNIAFTTGIDVTGINGRIINKSGLTYTKFDGTLNRDTVVSIAAGSGVNYSMSLRYIEIPLLFTGKTNEIGYFTYFLQGGLTPGFLIRQKAHITNANPASWEADPKLNSTAKDEFTTAQDNMIPIRLAFTVGAGCEYNFTGTTSMVASVRFNNGLFNIMKKADDRVVNNYISLNVGIVF